ncbi:hypothetical protein [Halarcobacter anaerophilus]|uniref:Uncharacterized protein n=1 Tax=Halarcobacter anaerophilus TaxID=877500 RepID=A0A4Q0Y1C6_9BACT|nr:hypothetical protein [Halarcobacter anaerophilus]QDF28525.1 hypothetical protein AANAER_1039 [Halarcobacter anaerophilus]RXJ63255.1 hypothetical protein CRV06_06130 [Halarcobacter anaerophilus]
MKNLFKIFLLLTFSNFCFAYEQGKIDTHGGKGDSLLNNKGFSNNIGLFSDKPVKKKKKPKEHENFIKIEQIQKIESKGAKNK